MSKATEENKLTVTIKRLLWEFSFILGIFKADPDWDPDHQKKWTMALRKSGPYTKIHCMS